MNKYPDRINGIFLPLVIFVSLWWIKDMTIILSHYLCLLFRITLLQSSFMKVRIP